jgi:hypothetical protein
LPGDATRRLTERTFGPGPGTGEAVEAGASHSGRLGDAAHLDGLVARQSLHQIVHTPLRQGPSRIVVELLEGEPARIEEVEDRLLDGFGEAEEERAVLLQVAAAGLDANQLRFLDREGLRQRLARLAAALAMPRDQRSRLPRLRVRRTPGLGQQARGRRFERDRDLPSRPRRASCST